MTEPRARQLLRGAAALTAAGLGLMMWSILVPTAMPVVLAMSVGQALGTTAFAMFGWVVFDELRSGRAAAVKAEAAKAEAAKAEAASAVVAAPEAPQGDGR